MKGHTEDAVDLKKLAGTQPAGVICEIMNEDGTMARVPELKEIATKFDLKMITIDQLITYREKHENVVQEVACVNTETEFGQFQASVYSAQQSEEETVALIKGAAKNGNNVLVR